MTLIDFLNARLDEDELIAQAARHDDAKAPGEWTTEHHNSEFHTRPDSCHIAEDRAGHYWTVASEVYVLNGIHMAHQDPARALREVAAKRALIANAEAYAHAEFPDYEGGYASACEDALRTLADVYSDHPDHRQEWS